MAATKEIIVVDSNQNGTLRSSEDLRTRAGTGIACWREGQYWPGPIACLDQGSQEEAPTALGHHDIHLMLRKVPTMCGEHLQLALAGLTGGTITLVPGPMDVRRLRRPVFHPAARQPQG